MATDAESEVTPLWLGLVRWPRIWGVSERASIKGVEHGVQRTAFGCIATNMDVEKGPLGSPF